MDKVVPQRDSAESTTNAPFCELKTREASVSHEAQQQTQKPAIAHQNAEEERHCFIRGYN
ncbi:hypothetical protein OAP14_06760 [Aliiglaciecola sp.]|nr:hypothetical protein [Aliiglaciecola sp.]